MHSVAGLTALVVAVCSCALVAYRYPVTATLLACIPVSLEVHYYSASRYGAASGIVWLAGCALGYQAGSRTTLQRSFPAVTLLVALWFIAGHFDQVPAFFAFGSWAVGVLVRGRTAVRNELEAKGRELSREQERLATQSIRYERARIARELHDIVAHCVSVMVVQAGAGPYLLARDPALAVEALDAISESATLAGAEIDRLVALLDAAPAAQSKSIDELVQRARATGLLITYRLVGDRDSLSTTVFDVVYRLVQEAMTNALKHAPGAPIDIALRCSAARLRVDVSNGPPIAPGLDFTESDGGHGLAGMSERVTACGGSLVAGPIAGGGWRVAADLPSDGLPASV